MRIFDVVTSNSFAHIDAAIEIKLAEDKKDKGLFFIFAPLPRLILQIILYIKKAPSKYRMEPSINLTLVHREVARLWI